MNRFFHQLNIGVVDEGILHFGQRVYVVATGNDKTYREKCPVCDDTRKISVRGFEFTCPNCNGYNHMSATHLMVYDFSVREYIINKIEIEGEKVQGIYKKDGSVTDGRYPQAKYSGFTRYGSSNDSISTLKFSSWSFERKDPEKTLLHNLSGSDYCFLKKDDAAAFVKRLHELQEERLAAFNKEHGTDHQYPFKY